MPYCNSGKGLFLPTICRFHGITILMYLRGKEHNPPHIHARTDDFEAPFLLETGEILDGAFPPAAKTRVRQFILYYQKELEEMWESGIYRKLPPENHVS